MQLRAVDNWASEQAAYVRAIAEHESAVSAWEASLEALRRRVDRIAYCGKCPVNIVGTLPRQYVVPTRQMMAASRLFPLTPPSSSLINHSSPLAGCAASVMMGAPRSRSGYARAIASQGQVQAGSHIKIRYGSRRTMQAPPAATGKHHNPTALRAWFAGANAEPRQT